MNTRHNRLGDKLNVESDGDSAGTSREPALRSAPAALPERLSDICVQGYEPYLVYAVNDRTRALCIKVLGLVVLE